MNTPKPTSSPSSGIALQPPGPSTPGRPASPAPARAPSPRRDGPSTVKVVHEKKQSPPVNPPSRFRLLVGFIAALIGAAVVAWFPDVFLKFVRDVFPTCLNVIENGVAALGSEPSGDVATRANRFVYENSQVVQWAPQVVGALLLLFAGWCLKKRLALFLVGSAVVYAVIATLSEAFGWGLPVWVAAMLAVATGYLIQCAKLPTAISLRGVFGLAIVCLATFGLSSGFFDWPGWATKVSTGFGVFVKDWQDVFLWGTILLLTAVGALMVRDRLPRFLIATIIVASIVLLFRLAYVEIIQFPGLGANVSEPRYSLQNLELWQWLALAEMVIVCAVLVYKSVGPGGLTVAVAALWLFCGLKADHAMGRLVFAKFTQSMMDENFQDSLYGKSNSPNGINGRPHPLSSRGILPVQTNARNATSSATNISRQDPAKPLFDASDAVNSATPAIWIYATAILIGLMAASGLRMLIASPDGRWWLNAVLWLFVGCFATCVAMRWPIAKTTTIGGWVAALTTHPIHREIILLVASASSAFFGTWSLRGGSRYHTWLYAAATAVFVGTILSFVALGVIIRWGGFPPLPVQSYIVLAIAQSALMWVLLLHANFARPVPVGAR